MRVRAYFNKHIIPSFAEGVSENIEYSKDNIYVVVKDITHTKEAREYIKGLKETEEAMVVKVEADVFGKLPKDIEAKDRMFIFGKEWRVDSVNKKIDNQKAANMIARNENLFDRYSSRVVVLR